MSNVLESILSAKTAKRQKVTQWVTLKDAAQILGVKIYTVRSLEWDNELGQRKTIGRRVYVQKSAVLAYRKRQGATDSETHTMTKQEYGQTVQDAIAVVADIVHEDKEITDKVYLSKLNKMFDRYNTIAQTLVK